LKEVCASPNRLIVLGHQLENRACCVTFDISEWETIYGNGVVQLLAQRCQDKTPYPCPVTIKAGVACWEIKKSDVAFEGKGKVELQYHVDDIVVKSETYNTWVLPSLGEAGPVPPDPEKSWVDAVLKAASEVENAAKDAVVENITIDANGNWFINGEDTGVSASGPEGKQGERGERGATGASGLPFVEPLYAADLSLTLENNTDYRCAEPVTSLTVRGFQAASDGRSEAWSIQFAAGTGITIALPDTVVWNCGATPVFTPGYEYSLMFAPLLNGKVLGVWNEVEA
jgi:hypothetical protein